MPTPHTTQRGWAGTEWPPHLPGVLFSFRACQVCKAPSVPEDLGVEALFLAGLGSQRSPSVQDVEAIGVGEDGGISVFCCELLKVLHF
jgi:hypothetical protein